MPFTAPLRRERQTPRSRSRSTTPAIFTPVISPSATPPIPSSACSSDDGSNTHRPPLSSGNLNGPQRNVSTSSNASGMTTTSASSTSSLEAMPIRPAAGTRIDEYGLAGTINGKGADGSRMASPAPGDLPGSTGRSVIPLERNGTAYQSNGFIVLSRISSNQSSPRADGRGAQRDDTLSPPPLASSMMAVQNTIRGKEAPTGVWSTSPSGSAPDLLVLDGPYRIERSRTPPSPSPAQQDVSNSRGGQEDGDPYTRQSSQSRRLSQATARQSAYNTSPSVAPPSSFYYPFPQSASSTTISPPLPPNQRPISAMQQLFLPAELRTSASGPDLASFQRDRERERRERARRSDRDGDADGDEADGEDDTRNDGFGNGSGSGGIRSGARPKVRTRSSGAQATQMEKGVSASPAGRPISEVGSSLNSNLSAAGSLDRLSARKAVTLQDFALGSVLGRGSYSVVVLASQNATNVPFAIKILDQQQLLQEKKTKYAKVERDALIRLGPRAILTVEGVDGKRRNGDRRGSTASVGSSRSRGKVKRELTEPGKRRRPSSAMPNQGEAIFEKDSGIAIIRERRSTEMRRESFSEVGYAMIRDHRDDQRSRMAERRPFMSSNGDGAPVSATQEAASVGIGGMSTSTSGSTLSAPSPRVATFPRAALRLQTSNLPAAAPDESALALSPDSVKSGLSTLLGGRDQSQQAGRRSAERRKRSSHPGVVRLHYTFKDHVSLYFVLDLAINGELLALIKKNGSLDIETTRIYAAQIIDTVDYMHERGVIHRDLKPENILLDDDMRVKITDFGSAKIVDPDTMLPVEPTEEGRKRSFVGTAEYVSPEVLQNDPASTASDIWAFGGVLFQMIAGRPPFRGATEYLTFQKVLKAEYEFPDSFDEQAKDLIKSIFLIDASARPSLETIKSHPFFTSPESSIHANPDPTDFAAIWTDLMPPIKSGLVDPPAPAPRHIDLTRHGWSDFLGHSATSGSEDFHENAIEEDDGLDSAEEEKMMRRPTVRKPEDSVGEAQSRVQPKLTGNGPTLVFPTEARDEDDDDLGAPRPQWIYEGTIRTPSSPVGTTASRTGTDDDVSLIGTGGNGSGSGSNRGSGVIGPNADGRRRPSESGSHGGVTIKQGSVDQLAPSRQVGGEATDPAWCNILLPSERIIYSSPILYRSPASLFLPKRRTLVLTSLPRLICVKEDRSNPDAKSKLLVSGSGPGTEIRVKAECLFGRAAFDLSKIGGTSPMTAANRGASGEKRPGKKTGDDQLDRVRRTVAKVWEKGPRAFVVQTPEKDHTFLADREDVRARWMAEIGRVQGDHRL